MRIKGFNRMVENYLENIPKDELILFENYAAGIKKLVEETTIYPPEFYTFFTGEFEKWTIRDSIAH